MSWEDLLESSRQSAGPEPGVRERVRARLQSELAAPAPPAAPMPAAAPAAAPSPAVVRGLAGLLTGSSRWWGKLLWGAVGLCAGFALGRGSVLRDDGLERPGAVSSSVVAEHALAQAVEPVTAAESALIPTPATAALEGASTPPAASQPAAARVQPAVPGRAAPTRAVPSRGPSTRAESTGAPPVAKRRTVTSSGVPRSPVTAPATSPALSDADRLREALAYVQRAHAALRAGDPSSALAFLAELDRRVPGDVLEEERAVTLALAWCDSGEPARASRVARRLLESSPSSVYAHSLAGSCVGRERLLEEMRQRTSKP